MMDRMLDEQVAVSPQLSAEDLPAIRAAGVTTVISNRPDAEVPPEYFNAVMAEAAAEAGLTFVENPLAPGMLSMDVIARQDRAINASEGKVLAYCASGTRSAYLWAFSMAAADRLSNDHILTAMARAGYPAPGLAPQLDQVRGALSA